MTQDSIAAQQLEIYLARRFIEQNMCITANQTNGRSPLQGAASLGGQTEDERVGAGAPQIQGSNWQGPGRSSAGGDRRFGRREVGGGGRWVLSNAGGLSSLSERCVPLGPSDSEASSHRPVRYCFGQGLSKRAASRASSPRRRPATHRRPLSHRLLPPPPPAPLHLYPRRCLVFCVELEPRSGLGLGTPSPQP